MPSPDLKNHFGQAVGKSVDNWVAPAHVMHAPLTRELNGQYCQLQSLSTEHREELKQAFANCPEQHWTYLPYGPMIHQEDYDHWLNTLCENNEKVFPYIIRSSEGEALGVAAFLRVMPEAGSIEIGHLSFAPALQKSTAATEAIFLMIEAAFMLGYRRCEWKCNALNEASVKAAKRFGFMYEGTFRNAMVSKGSNRDTAWYSIIEEEWPALKLAYNGWLERENFDAQGQQLKSLSHWMEPTLKELRSPS